MEKIIRVTGKGKISVKPDKVRLMLTLENMGDTYERALEYSAIQVEQLKDCFEKLGYDRTDLKHGTFGSIRSTIAIRIRTRTGRVGL